MTTEFIVGDGQFLDALLYIIKLTFDMTGRAADFFEEVTFTGHEALLLDAQAFKMLLLALDLFLLKTELQQLFLRGFDLEIDVVERTASSVSVHEFWGILEDE